MLGLNKPQSTTDYGLAAWIIDTKGVCDNREQMKIVKRGKAVFFFDLDDDQWFEFKKEYDLSCCCDHAKRMARLRDLTF